MNKNIKNQSNFFLRFLEVADVSLFIGVCMLLFGQIAPSLDFYLDYIWYISGITVLIGIFVKGFAGYKAAKNKESNIKPWMAGFGVALILGILGIIFTLVNMTFFPDNLMGGLGTDGTDMMMESSGNLDIDVDEEVSNEEIVTIENGESFDGDMIDSQGFGAGMIWLVVTAQIIGLIFSCLFGALFGFIGGAIGKD